MGLRKDIEDVINRNSAENGSNTPDFILAEYLTDCLAAFDKATNRRETWYGRANVGPGGGDGPAPISQLVEVPQGITVLRHRITALRDALDKVKVSAHDYRIYDIEVVADNALYKDQHAV